MIIHRNCTNITEVHYFRKHSRTTSNKLSTFVKTSFRVIYAKKQILSSYYFIHRGSVFQRFSICMNKSNSCSQEPQIEKKISGEMDESSNLLLFMGCFPHACIPSEPKLEATKLKKAEKFKCICAESVKVALLLLNSIHRIHTGKIILKIC